MLDIIIILHQSSTAGSTGQSTPKGAAARDPGQAGHPVRRAGIAETVVQRLTIPCMVNLAIEDTP